MTHEIDPRVLPATAAAEAILEAIKASAWLHFRLSGDLELKELRRPFGKQ